MNIEYLKSALRQPARSTLFDVEISGASSIQTLSTDVLKFTCKAAALPGSTFGKIEVPYYGRKIPYTGDRTYDDWNTTIIMNNDWTLYKELNNWANLFNHPYNNVSETANMLDYKCDGYVTMYDQTGSAKIKVKMVGMFPYQIQPLDLSWENNDQTADLQVTWFMDYWVYVA